MDDEIKEISEGKISSAVYFTTNGEGILYTQKYVEEIEKQNKRLNNIIKKALFYIDMDKGITPNWEKLTHREKNEYVLDLLSELENILKESDK